MDGKNLIIISIEEFRPDHLACYGHEDVVETPNIDRIARQGVVFETCIASSCLTPICCASFLTGCNPPVHGMRDPFGFVESDMLSEILQSRGYRTAGFAGNGLLSPQLGFSKGFDFFDEPKEEEAFNKVRYQDPDHQDWILEGNWWVDSMLDWLGKNYTSKFFAWGHFYETHEGSEYSLLEKGLMEEGRLSDFCYYDAKIELLDRALIGPLVETLEQLGVLEQTILVIMGDHGTTLGDHPANPVPYRNNVVYPQHTTLYDCDLHIVYIMRGPGLPGGKRVKGLVRAIDTTPTALDLLDISTIHQFDGVSLVPFIQKGEAKGLVAYAEELYELRGPGNFQAVRTDRYKYIVDRRHDNTEEFYDLASDPGEQSNIIDILDEEQQLRSKEARVLCDRYLGMQTAVAALSDERREEIKNRLRMLGYID